MTRNRRRLEGVERARADIAVDDPEHGDQRPGRVACHEFITVFSSARNRHDCMREHVNCGLVVFTVIHDTPGRLRLRAPLSELASLEPRARAITVAGVTEVSVNALTGSVLVRYAGAGVREALIASFGALPPKLSPDGPSALLADALTKALAERLASLAVAALI